MKPFDPNAAASLENGIFGLPFTADEARLHLIPIPWEVTTSYRGGTSHGPDAILQESAQVDLFDLETGEAYQAGIYLHPVNAEIRQLNDRLKPLVQEIKKSLESGREL